MNARERKRLIDAIDTYLPLEFREPIIRALRLLAATEANDGTTPETDAAIIRDKMVLSEVGLLEIVDAGTSSRLERERNGLAARVRELEKDAARSSYCTPQVISAYNESPMGARIKALVGEWRLDA